MLPIRKDTVILSNSLPHEPKLFSQSINTLMSSPILTARLKKRHVSQSLFPVFVLCVEEIKLPLKMKGESFCFALIAKGRIRFHSVFQQGGYERVPDDRVCQHPLFIDADIS